MADPRIKTLKIKTGVVKRLTKETSVYEREAEQQKIRVDKLKEANKEDYSIKKQEEVLHESLMMLPDCQRRLTAAYDDLKKIIDEELDLVDSGEYLAAKEALEAAEKQIKKPADI